MSRDGNDINVDQLPLDYDILEGIDQKYGPKQHLLLLDNNVLNTPDLEVLVDDLCEAGFGRGAKYVDPGAYNIVMMRYHNGDRAEFLDKKMMAYLESFKKRIKSAEMLDTFPKLSSEQKKQKTLPSICLNTKPS